MKTKRALRQQLIKRRTRLKPQERFNLSQQICEQILSHLSFQHSKYIALYSATGNEVEISALLTQPKTILLPVIQSNNGMTFNQFESTDRLVKNKYGILEPSNNRVIMPKNLDLCLMPLVGFSRDGNRLGMGGGYYDRYFEMNKSQKKPTILAGVAYDFQENATIQAESWDIPLDIIFTNKEVITP